MSFTYVNDRLHCGTVDLKEVAQTYGTPVYVYSESVLKRNAQVIKAGFIDRGFKVSYALKANSNPAILKLLHSYGMGADIVSAGELKMAQWVGFESHEVNFAGVGKTREELDLALEADIDHFNVESQFELQLLEKRAAESGKRAAVLLRLNPDIDPRTHPHISTGLHKNKFGMNPEIVQHILTHADAYPHIKLDGIHCHIGSQIIRPQPFFELIEYLVRYTAELRSLKVELSHLDLGGGFGVNYHKPFEDILETTPYLESLAEDAMKQLHPYQLHIQPGRVLVANSAVLLTTVLGTKVNDDHHFTVVDGATTELIRPALYDAYHDVRSYTRQESVRVSDVVGPVCESSDILAKAREIPDMEAGDLMVTASAGAYASAMSSTYNLRPLSPEVLVTEQGKIKLIKRRQTFEEMISLY